MGAYSRIGNQGGWCFTAGQFYLPFGFRLQDQSAYVREATQINMDQPDTGVELGLERGSWSAQLDVTNGFVEPSKSAHYQLLGNVVHTESRWRAGASAAFTQAATGDRIMGGLFAGLRTGPIAWLAEVDLINQESSEAGVSNQTMIPALV